MSRLFNVAIGTVMGVGTCAFLSYITQFKKVILVDKKEVNTNCKLSPILGDRYMIKDSEFNFYNTRRVFWDWPPTLNEEGVFNKFQEGEAYEVEGYGFEKPEWHIYPNITRVTRLDEK